MYKIKLAARAKKELKYISTLHKQALTSVFEELKDGPFLGKPLARELTGRFSYRVSNYRVIYKINKKEKIIQVITAGHRSKVYK